MEEFDFHKEETSSKIHFNPIQIELNGIKNDLKIKSKGDIIFFSINDKQQFPSIKYIRKMNFEEIKDLNAVFNTLNSLDDFYDYFKTLSKNQKLSIKKEQDKILIIFYVDVLLKQEKIEIKLFPKKKDIDSSLKEICQEILNMKEKIKEIDGLEKENKELKNEINNLKNKNQILEGKIEKQNKIIEVLKGNFVFDKSVIMKEDEENWIYTEIENKMNKKIKNLNKLYQATIDGGDSKYFHLKCDNIPDTLVLIKSEDKRRFGGFTPIPWKSEGEYIKDPEQMTFVFSLDNKKIYPLKIIEWAVYHQKDSGPCFGGGRDIAIDGNPIKENTLYNTQYSFDYKGDILALSEYKDNKLKIIEYEVFQVIFD